jgi:hypothetical protein
MSESLNLLISESLKYKSLNVLSGSLNVFQFVDNNLPYSSTARTNKNKNKNDKQQIMAELIYTPDQFLLKGLKLLRFTDQEVQRVHRKNVNIFRSQYGSDSLVCSEIWADLQTTDTPDARIDTSQRG